MTNTTGECNLTLTQEVLEVFPETARKERGKHMMISDPQMGSVGKCIISDRKLQPGMMTVRGYAYAGSKGVVFGPIRDMAHISHGPTGCGQYSRAGRHNYYTGVSGVDGFGTLSFISDFQERGIVFGGDKKLTKLTEGMEQLFLLTKGIITQSECPVGLIGDDISAVTNASSKALDKPVIPVHCEGFRGVSQSLGYHTVNDVVHDWVLNNREGQLFASTSYGVAIIGDYNIGGDAWVLRILPEKTGLRLVVQWFGDGTLVEMENTSFVKLNLVHYYRSMNYIARHMEEKHQIPWMEHNFFGLTKIVESLRKIADQFDDTVRANVKAVAAKHGGQMATIIIKYRPWLGGHKVLLYMGGPRPCHVVGAYEDLGMEIIAADYELTHNDDYDCIPPGLKEGTLLLDDTSSYELEAFVKALKLGLIGSGIKEKYIFQKMGVPLCRMHSRDYSGPCHGYDGPAIFARDMDMTLNDPAQNELTAL